MVNVGVMVGVNVAVGIDVSVGVKVNVGWGVSVGGMAVAATVAWATGDTPQAININETTNRIRLLFI